VATAVQGVQYAQVAVGAKPAVCQDVALVEQALDGKGLVLP